MNKSITLLFACLFFCLYSYCNPLLFNPFSPGSPVEQIRSNLYVKQGNANPILLDGDLTQYDPSFSNALDGLDARKMSNFSENIGMARGTYVLVVERRQTITATDTIFYKMWQMHQRTYQLEFITNNLDHPGLQGFLEDNYLKTSTPVDLNGATKVDFTIDANVASADAYRFRIIFKSIAAGPLPLTLTSIKASRVNKYVKIDWTTANESNLKIYTVEKSDDGNRFSQATTIKANNLSSNTYSWLDTYSSSGNSYYRVMTTEIDGKVTRSAIMKVAGGKSGQEMHVFPNPVVNNTIHLEIAGQPAGIYSISLLNINGQAIYQEKINHPGGDFTRTIRPNQNLVKGVYQLQVSTPAKEKITEKIIY